MKEFWRSRKSSIRHREIEREGGGLQQLNRCVNDVNWSSFVIFGQTRRSGGTIIAYMSESLSNMQFIFWCQHPTLHWKDPPLFQQMPDNVRALLFVPSLVANVCKCPIFSLWIRWTPTPFSVALCRTMNLGRILELRQRWKSMFISSVRSFL